MNKKLILIAALSALAIGCTSTSDSGNNTAVKATNATPANSQQTAFHVLLNIPYSKDSAVEENVKTECTELGKKLSLSMVKYAKKHNIQVVQHQNELPTKGHTAIIEIQDVYSGGNAFVGHYKSATVSVQYLIDGKVVATTSKKRRSSGGLFAGFKGSCSVLGRTVHTLGSDVDKWLSQQKFIL